MVHSRTDADEHATECVGGQAQRKRGGRLSSREEALLRRERPEQKRADPRAADEVQRLALESAQEAGPEQALLDRGRCVRVCAKFGVCVCSRMCMGGGSGERRFPQPPSIA